jgi:hypothetical protein
VSNSLIRWGMLLLIIGGLTLGIYLFVNGLLSDDAQIAALHPHLSQFVNITGTGGEPTGEPYVRGRILPLDVEMKDTDDALFKALPRSLRPTKPEEVGTIVWLKYGLQKIESHISQVGHGVQTVEMTIVDRAQNRVLARKFFIGEPPTQTSFGLPHDPKARKEMHMSRAGPAPIGAMAGYLVSLPRK